LYKLALIDFVSYYVEAKSGGPRGAKGGKTLDTG